MTSNLNKQRNHHPHHNIQNNVICRSFAGIIFHSEALHLHFNIPRRANTDD